MKGLIRNALRQECEKHIERYFEYLEDLHQYQLRKTQREGIQFNKVIKPRLWWALAAGFNPFKVRVGKVLETYSHTLATKIRRKQYKPKPCVLYFRTKEDGSRRPLNIFQLPDAAVSGLIFKSLLRKNATRFSGYSYAYREDKTPHHAVFDIFCEWQKRDRVYVAEYDFSKFFDKISHEYLLKVLKREGFTMSPEEEHVVRAFLRSESAEKNSYPLGAVERNQGIPQGTSVSLFLANIACWELDRGLEKLGVRFARYADDTVVWSDDYSRVVSAYYLIDECAAKMGVPINLLKSQGISLLSKTGRVEELTKTKDSIDYLGYRISLDVIAIKELRVERIKSRISYLIYQNLLQPLKKGIFNPKRLKGPIDLDYLTATRQVRSYLYGGLTDEKLHDYLVGRTPDLNFRGVMSYYPIVTDIQQLTILDGWLAHTFRQALRARSRLWQKHSGVVLPGPSIDWIDQIRTTTGGRPPNGTTVELMIPSFRLINRAMKLAIERKGLAAVANPSSKYYAP